MPHGSAVIILRKIRERKDNQEVPQEDSLPERTLSLDKDEVSSVGLEGAKVNDPVRLYFSGVVRDVAKDGSLTLAVQGVTKESESEHEEEQKKEPTVKINPSPKPG